MPAVADIAHEAAQPLVNLLTPMSRTKRDALLKKAMRGQGNERQMLVLELRCVAHRATRKRHIVDGRSRVWDDVAETIAYDLMAALVPRSKAARMLGVPANTISRHIPDYIESRKPRKLLKPGAICGTCDAWHLAEPNDTDPLGHCPVQQMTTRASGQCVEWRLIEARGRDPIIPPNRRGDDPEGFDAVEKLIAARKIF